MGEDSGQNAHLVGVCGAGMKALAELLLDSGWSLTGSDLMPANASIQRLIERGLDFSQGHASTHVSNTTHRLIYSSAIPVDNPERLEARRRSLPEFTYSQMVAQLMKQSTGVCIAGTHGKSTTTAMTAWILDAAGRTSGVVFGAELCEGGRSGWSGEGDLFVAESCEFQQSFLDYQPRYSAILSVEPDHFDCYSNLESLEAAFREFAVTTAADGLLLVNDDCAVSRSVSANAATLARRVTFGLTARADWTAEACRGTANGTRFSLCHAGKPIIEIELSLHGKHNVCNALAAASLCAEIGIAPEILREALGKFRGLRRRLEFVGECNGALLIDDYAHHPTAVKITLETVRKLVDGRRIVCVFQPHQVGRTTALMEEFATSFVDADEVLLAPVFAAREYVTDEPRLVSQKLANRILSHGVSARAFSSLDQIVTTLEDATRPGDVIVTMGAGDIDRIHHELTRRIQ